MVEGDGTLTRHSVTYEGELRRSTSLSLIGVVVGRRSTGAQSASVTAPSAAGPAGRAEPVIARRSAFGGPPPGAATRGVLGNGPDRGRDPLATPGRPSPHDIEHVAVDRGPVRFAAGARPRATRRATP